MTAPQPPPAPLRDSSSSYLSPAQLEARNRRGRRVGIVLMIVGILFGGVQVVLQILETLAAIKAGKPIPTPSIIEIVHEYGFPVALSFAGYELFNRHAAADLISWIKSLLGKGS